MGQDLANLDAIAQAELVRRGDATPLELVDAAIARIEKLNPELGAVIHTRFEAARADAASRALPDGPFRGVPFLMKDLGGPSAGDPFHSGMAFLKRAGWRAKQDAYVTAKLRASGVVIVGRTNTPELGLLPTTEPAAYGPTRNPWDPTRSAGGSSGGSAAAVAAGLVPAAHSSDGGGSIRIPAAHCGLVGLKPSRGRLSFGPDLGERWNGFSAEGVVTRTVRDTAALVDAMAGAMPGDPYTAPPLARPLRDEVGADPGRLRVGLMARGPREMALHPDCARAARDTAALLESLGHRVEEAHPEALDDIGFTLSFVTIVASNTARALETWSESVGQPIGADDVEPLTWALAEAGRRLSAANLLGALQRVHALSRRMAAWWESGFDLLLTPTCAEPPPALGAFAASADNPTAGYMRAAPFGAFTSAFNATGQPAVSLPLAVAGDGLPIGVQLVARAGGEAVLVRVAAQLEAAQPWHGRRPALHA
jgi:amidase